MARRPPTRFPPGRRPLRSRFRRTRRAAKKQRASSWCFDRPAEDKHGFDDGNRSGEGFCPLLWREVVETSPASAKRFSKNDRGVVVGYFAYFAVGEACWSHDLHRVRRSSISSASS